MGIIIQLIIVFIIIASVVKRFKEITGKSNELEKTKLPEQLFEMSDVERPQEGPIARPSPEPLSEEPVWEPSQPVKVPAGIDEDAFESRPEIEVSESRLSEGMTKVGGLMPEIRTFAERPRTMISPARRRPHIPVLRFNQNQVVRGIIMGEILGPPVGLRDRERFISGIV